MNIPPPSGSDSIYFDGNVEAVRFSGELVFADQLAEAVSTEDGHFPDPPAADRLRRRLLTSHVRLSQNMAPEVFSHARRATAALRLEDKPLELYQAAGQENASNWYCADVIFVSFQGKMISLLDEESFVALLGHEFGHHLAHTDCFGRTSRQAMIRLSTELAFDPDAPDEVRALASRLSMGKEFTADRFAALACGSIRGAVRLMMSVVTGLPAERLVEDEEAYIAQACALFAPPDTAVTGVISSHPEHLLRAYALLLFSETDTYRQLTGQGSGQRSLTDVDARLSAILGGSEERIFETENDEILPPEVQEFSLVAAMLLAVADGELRESEIQALEETFAEVLPDWRDFVENPEAASERYAELLPLMIIGGVSAAASVFHVLIHVMLCDQEVHIRELEMLTSIGRSLNQERFFNHMLAAVAKNLRVERSGGEMERPLPALPPGKSESHAALDALFRGMARRGGGSTSLARILRILGRKTWDAAHLPLLTKSAASHELELAAPPVQEPDGSVRLDQTLLFRLAEKALAQKEASERETGAESLARASSRDALLIALKHLREKLVSGDGRSPSVRLYRAAAGRHFDLAQADRVIAGRSERVVAMLHDRNVIPLLSGEEAGLNQTSTALARALRNLDREFRARVEETGAVDFHLGYPFLVGMVSGFFVRAPLILHPFSLHGDHKGAGGYTLRRRDDEPAFANQALLRLLFAKISAPFTEELATELNAKAAQGTETLLQALRHLGLDPRPLSGAVEPLGEMSAATSALLGEGLSLAEHAVAGFFPQSNSDLLQDYDELLSKLDTQSQTSLETALNAASDMLPAAYRPAFHPPRPDDSPDQPVIYADPSQRAAVRSARSARLLVLDGPPGTGKSQTIVNLVADTLARGGKVAVICEKRVALDVVKQRLDAAGIGHLAILVHDVMDDRKAVCAQIADRLESTERKTFDPSSLSALREEAEELEGFLLARRQALSTGTPAGLSLGQLHAMAASFRTPAAAAENFDSVDQSALKALLALLHRIRPDANLFCSASPFQPSGPDTAPRPSLARTTAKELDAISEKLTQAVDSTLAYHRAYAALPLETEVLEGAEVGLSRAAAFAQAAAAGPRPEIPARALMLRGDKTRAGHIEQALAELDTHREYAESEKVRVALEAPEGFGTSLVTARLKCGSFFRFLSGDWRRASRQIREWLAREWPEEASTKITPVLLGKIERRFKASEAWKAASRLYKELGIPSELPRQADVLFSDDEIPAIQAAWKNAGLLSPAESPLRAIGLWPLDADGNAPDKGWSHWASQCRLASDLLLTKRACHQAVWSAAEHFPHAASLALEELEALRDAFTAQGSRLAELDRKLAPTESLIPGMSSVLRALADLLPEESAEAWSDSLCRAWAEAHVRAVSRQFPEAAILGKPAPLGGTENISRRLLEIHKRIAEEESRRIAAGQDTKGLMAVPPAEARARRTPEQSLRETLIKECRKQRNVTPLRTLVRRSVARGLLDVAPIWLMSPETTAILFPREPVFDLLIIDEASQCTVENGLPVLTRARQAVIAGDDKQMPPSSFFKAGGGLDLPDEDEGNVPDVAADSFDAESLLSLARQGSAGAPLRWHYRALFEELIAFSNHSMYGGSLLTIPAVRSRSAEPALRWVRLNNGVWEQGVNAPEAAKTVDIMGELLARPDKPSVGVVTFNLVQRRAILDEIDRRRAEDPAFAELFDAAASAESLDARPFVKNLESVQGDERDVILFSLGYAPAQRKRKDGAEETYVPARFGPLGQKGGERRLNVAVSRAKSEIIVVSSFDPSMLSVAKAKNDGPRLFKSFVEFARHLGEGRRTQAEKVLALVNDTRQTARLNSAKSPETLFLPLSHQITEALESSGHAVETMIGSSEFRLPVAVVKRDDPGNYALAILCEDGTGETNVYEDYVHIPNVLAHRKWSYLRVTSYDWNVDREGVLRRITNALEMEKDR